MKEPRKRDCLSLWITLLLDHILILSHRGQYVYWLELSDLHTCRLPLGLKRPVDVVPERTVLLLVVGANIVSPPCRLHKHHSNQWQAQLRDVPGADDDIVPRMFLQHRCYLVDGWRVLLPQDLISDDPMEHVAENVPGRSGKRQYGKREK
jgi:hypothetical protein